LKVVHSAIIGVIGEMGEKEQCQYYGEIGGLKTPDLLGLQRNEEESMTTLDRIRNIKELKKKHQNINKETPSIRDYKLVKLKELDVLSVLDSPIMTWGEVLGEPEYLGRTAYSLESIQIKNTQIEGPTEPTARFKVPETSEREQLSQELVARTNKRKAMEKYANQERKKINATPTVYRKMTDLSQSGRRLLEKAGGLTSSIFDKPESSIRNTGRLATPNIKFSK
jgi:hypothetical protein